ncbi:MAG: hypothetical protein F4018_04050 [Acidobacteria bacterium]|nr:hypothetical protein [Acidobacteriota bacterium]
MPRPADVETVPYDSQYDQSARRGGGAGGGRPASSIRPSAEPEFPGCRPFRLTKEDVEAFEGRFEYWSADTETAWKMCEPTSRTHEQPSQRLAALGQVIAAVRGAPIECYGSMDLILRNERGEKWRILQADQVAYLYPGRARLPVHGLVIGEHDLPDVVVEVDHTTDVRRGKLGLYEAWGFPEVWVDIPDQTAPSRPAGRTPGLAIHLLDGDRFRTTNVSRAFPGWTAAEIHAAMNERLPSAATTRVLERVGRTLGARDGTCPDDTPWLRRQRAEGRAAGHAEGRATGHVEGRTAGHAEGRLEGFVEGRAELLNVVVRRTLASRGISNDVTLDPADLAGLTDEHVMDALLECRDTADFRARLRYRRRRPGCSLTDRASRSSTERGRGRPLDPGVR